jgi:outer membrane receptor protein involved in Fe transport
MLTHGRWPMRGARASTALLVAGAALLAHAPAARAGDTADLEGLLDEAVVSSASRDAAQTASTAPATTTTITAEDLRRYGIHSLDEALNFLSLGMIAENPRETVEVGARGVLLTRDYGDHMLLLVDGHAMNEQWGGAAYFDRGAGVPFEMIDHIEVILGPGSVLYGSNAMMGVINIVTKRAKDFAGLRGVVESELPSSIRGVAGFGRQLRLFGQRGEVTAAVEYFASRGPAVTFGPQRYGADDVSGGPRRFSSSQPATGVWGSAGNPDLLFEQVPSAYARLVVGGFELTFHGAMFKRWGPFVGGGDLGSTKGYELDRWLSLDARYHATLSEVARLSVRLYGDLYDYHERDPLSAVQDCLDGQTRGCIYDLDGRSRWAGADVQSSFDWLKSGRLVTLLGLDARLRYAEGSTGEYTDAVTGKSGGVTPPYSAVEKALAVFVEQTARPTAWLGLNAGARVDVDQRFGAHFSPRLAAVASPWSGGHFKAVYAEAFRAPTAYERYYFDPKAELAAPDLRPETVRSVEGSFEQRLGAQRLLVTVFHTWWNDLVVSSTLTDAEIAAAQKRGELAAGVTYASQYRNASSVTNYGGSLGIDGGAVAQRLRYGLGVTGAYARQEDGDGTPAHTLPAAAQLFGNARVSYDLGGRLPVLALAGRFAGSRPISGTSFTPTPSVGPLVELRVTASGPFPGVAGLSYRASGNFVVASGNPYGVGPLGPTPTYRTRETVPLDRYRATVGLEYALPL